MRHSLISIEMSTQGKYVLAPAEAMQTGENLEESFYSDELLSPGLGAVQEIELDGAEHVETLPVSTTVMETTPIQSEINAPTPDLNLLERISHLEKVIVQLTKSLASPQGNIRMANDENSMLERTPPVEKGWTNVGESVNRVNTSIRWEQIPPFPKDVSANKLWEAWQRFLENFEIAVSLSNVDDPICRTKLLFLTMGADLQGIVRAAKLRPSLDDSSCYSKFVSNVDAHLKSMTDISSEHEAFTGMHQEKGESVVTFHSRLTEKGVNAISIDDVLVDCRLGSSLPITFMIDSGSDVNIIGGSDWAKLKKQLQEKKIVLNRTKLPENRELHAYATKESISIRHAFMAQVEVVGMSKPTIPAEFMVVDKGRRSLLGRSTASELRLLEVGMAVNNCENSEKLEIFPKMPNVKVKFSVNRATPPEKNAYYNVPAAYREGARQRLEEMEARGIIERVHSAPEWISGMSAVPKGKNDFRLVVNMRSPNKAIKREYFRLPLLEEMKIKLHGSRYFTKLDLNSAYYHLEIAKESRDLTTFLTENGMYRFTRLMFGVNCAPEIFQREMCRILEGIDNVIVYIDDILIFADTLEALRSTTEKVLKVLRNNNLSLNVAKCEYEKTYIKFLGHELDEKGFHVDEAKIKDIRRFRQPNTVSELRSFLGLASFLSSYIKNFADLTSPLWAVSTAKSWFWGQEQEKAFNVVKEEITNCTTTLGYFSEQAKTILYTDASPIALGAVLVQQNENQPPRIISFASKALTTTERKYAQNQREALSAVWAVEHLAFFLLGRHFTLRTDAEGVTFILNRTRESSKRALTRADGWALRLSPYDYDIEFVRGRDNIADPSSRLYVGNDAPFDDDRSPWEIASIEMNDVGFLTEK
ncbi:uncharacterized protein LOC131433780 [Malaya genurostris]|uniref:uncharacterized protein LOC131433780 n=1 Tax=Malaya genurostris TaxID=325434 RepID=UPI0026F3A1FE|nr:uncharacterized protein LOC131433780 [Malaya genurostris]